MPLTDTLIRQLKNDGTYQLDLSTQAFGDNYAGLYSIDPTSLCLPPLPNGYHSALNDTFNCNLCPNDVAYFQLYENGEKLYVFFAFDDYLSPDITSPTYGWKSVANPTNVLITAELLDIDQNVLSSDVDDFCDAWMNAYREDTNSNYQVLEIDTSLISETCWQIKYTVEKRGGQEVFFSEPYRKVNCEETVLIEGLYTFEDCMGNYYGTPTAAFGSGTPGYLDRYRVPANLEKDNFDLSRETIAIDSRVISTQKIENYLFRTRRLPEYEADKVINSFSAKTVKLDSVEYTELEGFSKNNESGSMWIVNTEVGIKKEEIKFGCN